ncbi:MAG: phosphotransferase [Saprospiraceae bacterium]|nr:phosphotransferase [Saprospiraceae bacterium]
MKNYQLLMTKLFEDWSGEAAAQMDQIAQAGSDRRYFRIRGASKSAIGTYNAEFKENKAFIRFTQHFWKKGLPVPEVYAESLLNGVYLQEDLGDAQLFNFLPPFGEPWHDDVINLYKKSVVSLADLQIRGGEDLDYSVCYPRAAFDKQSMMWDLNYFKHYFLKLAKVPFDEQALEDDFQKFTNYLLLADCNYFLFRDFQSRNIMIKDGNPYFIDYQGGRKGALQYDVASLLYQAKGGVPPSVKKEVFEHYLDKVDDLVSVDRDFFTDMFYGYVLIRCLQALGAYGFRGLYERKEHFMSSIPFAINQIEDILGFIKIPVKLPELFRCLELIVKSDQFEGFDKKKYANSPLTVKVNSFSYKKTGYPSDPSVNGGGFVFDCRFIENPGRYEEYKRLTGRDKPVIDFLKSNGQMDNFLQNVYGIVDKAVENYLERQFDSLMVNFGCTGGQHRSVYAADQLAKHLMEKYGVKVALQHIEQEKKAWVN